MFEREPTILRVGAYSVDPARFADIVSRYPGAGPMLGVEPRDPENRAEAADPADRADPADQADAADPADTADSANPAGAADPAAEWAVKQAVLRALGAPIRLRARWPEIEVSRDPDGRWRVTSRGPVRQFHEAHTLGHVDVSVSETDGRITAFAVLTRDVTSVPEPLPGPADLPDRVASAVVNGPIDPTEY